MLWLMRVTHENDQMESCYFAYPAPLSLLWQHHNFSCGNSSFLYQFMCFGWRSPTQAPGVGIWARTSWLGHFVSLVTVTGPETGTGSKWVQWQLISGFLLEWHKKALWFHKTVSNKEANVGVPGATPQGLRMMAAQSKVSQEMKRELHKEIMWAPESNCAWSK